MAMASSPPPVRRDDHLLWVDLEMTGLDVQHDVILQAAAIITNADLQPLAEWSCDVWQPEAKLQQMTPYVRQMHEKTGLIERVRRSLVADAEAEAQLLNFVSGWCCYKVPVCGNSVGQDKAFIDRYWPGVGRYLHYRVVDVSTLKILAKRWYGESAVFEKSAVGEHDALVDIKNSIAELAHYRRKLFAAPGL